MDFPVPGCPFIHRRLLGLVGESVQVLKRWWVRIQEQVWGWAWELVSRRRAVIEGKEREWRHAGAVSCCTIVSGS